MPVNFIPAKPAPANDREWTIEALRRRLADAPAQDVERAARRVIEVLAAFNRAPTTRRPVAAADFMRAHVESLMPRLLARIDGAVPPLSKPVRQQAYLVEKLLKEMAIAYTRIIARSSTGWAPFARRTPTHAPLVRAMDLLSRRLHLSYRLYARAPRGVWVTMHEVYRIARARKAAELPLTAPETTAGAIYRKALLLAFTDPSRLAPHDLQRTRDYIARFAADTRLTSESAPAETPGVFVIDAFQDRPGVQMSRHRSGGHGERVLYLRTQDLLQRIRLHLDRLEADVPPDELGLPPDPDPRQYQALLARLASAWSGGTRKRSSRLQFRPRAELRVGIPAVWAALEGSGHAENAERGGTPINEWTIVNESPNGFALRHINGHVPPLRVGDLVGVRPRGRTATAVCVIRWIQAEASDTVDLGLQQIAPKVVPVTFRPVDAKGTAIVPALFAPAAPQFDRAPILVLPARVLGADREITINFLGAAIKLRAEQIVERTPLADVARVAPR